MPLLNRFQIVSFVSFPCVNMILFSDITILVGWLFWVKWLFETVFQSIAGHLLERMKKKRNDR